MCPEFYYVLVLLSRMFFMSVLDICTRVLCVMNNVSICLTKHWYNSFSLSSAIRKTLWPHIYPPSNFLYHYIPLCTEWYLLICTRLVKLYRAFALVHFEVILDYRRVANIFLVLLSSPLSANILLCICNYVSLCLFWLSY